MFPYKKSKSDKKADFCAFYFEQNFKIFGKINFSIGKKIGFFFTIIKVKETIHLTLIGFFPSLHLPLYFLDLKIHSYQKDNFCRTR